MTARPMDASAPNTAVRRGRFPHDHGHIEHAGDRVNRASLHLLAEVVAMTWGRAWITRTGRRRRDLPRQRARTRRQPEPGVALAGVTRVPLAGREHAGNIFRRCAHQLSTAMRNAGGAGPQRNYCITTKIRASGVRVPPPLCPRASQAAGLFAILARCPRTRRVGLNRPNAVRDVSEPVQRAIRGFPPLRSARAEPADRAGSSGSASATSLTCPGVVTLTKQRSVRQSRCICSHRFSGWHTGGLALSAPVPRRGSRPCHGADRN